MPDEKLLDEQPVVAPEEPVVPEQPEVAKPEAAEQPEPSPKVEPKGESDAFSKLEKRIEQMREQLAEEQKNLYSQLKQSQKATISDRVEKLAQQIYAEQARVIEKLVQGGSLDPQAARLERAEAFQDARFRAAQMVQREPEPTPQGPDPRVAITNKFQEIMQDNEVDFDDPEYKEAVAGKDLGHDPDEAVKTFKKLVRQASKAKEARLLETAKQEAEKKAAAQKKAVSIDTGSGASPSTKPTADQIVEQMQSIMRNRSKDPSERKKEQKKLDELEAQLTKM